MSLLQFLESDIYQYIKFALWILLTIAATILVGTRVILHKFKAPTDKIDKWILELEIQKTKLLGKDVKDVSKQIKKGNKINLEKTEKLINELYENVVNNDSINKKGDH